jgi:hypothetical protein
MSTHPLPLPDLTPLPVGQILHARPAALARPRRRCSAARQNSPERILNRRRRALRARPKDGPSNSQRERPLFPSARRFTPPKAALQRENDPQRISLIGLPPVCPCSASQVSRYKAGMKFKAYQAVSKYMAAMTPSWMRGDSKIHAVTMRLIWAIPSNFTADD